MATQITDTPQPYGNNDAVALGTLEVVRFVCDQFRNGQDRITVNIQQFAGLGGLGLEAIKSFLESDCNCPLAYHHDPASGFVTFFAVVPMPSPASTSTDSTNAAASPKKDGAKIPRPKNAFVIYRLHNHERVKAEHPGLHNNEISKIIGRDWRAASQAVRDEYKVLAEDEKRQHTIDHPGYQYQPRKPSEKKKRMTKNKRAKLDAQSSSTDATTSATTFPAQQGQQTPSVNVALPYQNNTSQLTDLNGIPASSFDGVQGAVSVEGLLDQLDGDSFTLFEAGVAASGGLEWAANPTATHEEAHMPDPYAEQSRQEQLDISALFDFEEAAAEEGVVPEGLAPAQAFAGGDF